MKRIGNPMLVVFLLTIDSGPHKAVVKTKIKEITKKILLNGYLLIKSAPLRKELFNGKGLYI